MIGGLKPYDSMKDSGVPWIGKIPNHWELVRLGALVRERGETNEMGLVTDVLSVTRDRGVIPYAEKGNIGNKKSEDITRYKIVRPNDIVVNCMNVIIGSVGISNYTGCLSPVYYVLANRHGRDNPRYLNAYFQTKPFQESLVRIGNGILSHRMRIPMELLKCELFPRPPLDEQNTIVRFVDHASRRIQNYIRLKRRLIKLFEEQKQATIHRAVTTGLDQNAIPKPTEVPADWSVVRLGCYLRKIEQGWSPVAAEGDVSEGQYSVLTLSSIKRGRFFPQAIKPIPVTEEIPTEIEIRDGDLLLSRSNTRELVGDVCMVVRPQPRTLFPDLIYRLSLDLVRLKPRFLMYVLLSAIGRRQIQRDARGSSGTMPKISQGHIRSWRIPVPQPDEQLSIVKTLDSEAAQINKAISGLESEIELIRAFGARLTVDVVMGRLDVRSAHVILSEGLPTSASDTVSDETAVDESDETGMEIGARTDEGQE